MSQKKQREQDRPKRLVIDSRLYEILSHRSIDERTTRQGCLHSILCNALGRPDLLATSQQRKCVQS